MVTSQYERMAKADLEFYLSELQVWLQSIDEISKTKSTNIVGIISGPQISEFLIVKQK